ncbi:MAG: hypothetical protein PWR27_2496 [Petroclostridium sp.]|jgi:uncharacterized protein YybS (DUF2232 family)|nr:hypothetical protein [Clostridia bacterium]MDK2811787.1 hypothetical protein [Petroclostridium sp.]
MSYNWDTKRLLEAAYLTAIMTFFAAAGLYVPGLMVFTIFLSAIPLVILTIKAGEKIAILSIAACYILIILLTGEIIVATTTLFSFCFAGLALGYGLKSKWEFNKLFIFSSGAYLVSLLATILLINNIEGINLIDKLIIEPVTEFFTQAEKDLNEVAKALGNNQVYAGGLTILKDIVGLLIPSFFIVSSTLFGYITLILSKSILNRIGYDYRYLPRFFELKVNRGTAVVFVLSFILSITINEVTISAALANITFILSVILMVCGLSVLDFFVKKAGIPGYVRVIIYIIVFAITTLLGVVIPLLHPLNALIILALIDSTFDFRKLGHKGENHGQ